MNILHSPNVPFVNRSNGGYLLENFHFVGGSMNHSTTPSPIGSSDDGAAQVETQETIDLEGDDSIQVMTVSSLVTQMLEPMPEPLLETLLHQMLDQIEG